MSSGLMNDMMGFIDDVAERHQGDSPDVRGEALEAIIPILSALDLAGRT